MFIPHYEIHCKKNLELLKTMADNSLDAVVTDCPYGLGKEPDAVETLQSWITTGYHEIKGAGFMGKKWDSFVPQPLFWKEVFRVLKPGGYVLAFFGTRTYDWGTMAIRLAGFEIRDCIQWIYGCLSNDSDIFTKNGWRKFDEIKNTDEILCYCKESDSYHFEKPTIWNDYSIKDTCYRIQSDYTDQIVSRNHRCLIEREGTLLFEFAENLSQEHKTSIPFLESLPLLCEDISNLHEGTGVEEQGLFESVRRNFVRNKAREGCKAFNRKKVLALRRHLQNTERQDRQLLQQGLQRDGSRSGLETTRQKGPRELDSRIGKEFGYKNDGEKQSVVEGWDNLQVKERLLPGSKNKIRSLPRGIYKHGTKGRLRYGVQTRNGKAIRQTANENRSSSSYQPQPHAKRNNKPNVIQEQQRPQEIRGGTSYKTTMATVTDFEYDGVIFCPTVSTGSFVARRNGKIFITGNSGFPKSLDVSKQLDKQAGAERTEIIKEVSKTPKYGTKEEKANIHVNGGTYPGDYSIKAPASDDAKTWDGYGTAIKPSHEDICLARKPFEVRSDFDKYFIDLLKEISIEICQLPSFALIVSKYLMFNQKEKNPQSIVVWSVENNTNIPEVFCVLMDTLQLESATNTNWSTALLWVNILGALYEQTNTFTTATKLSTTTELKILLSLPWADIFRSFTPAPNSQTSGHNAHVSNADSLLNVIKLKLENIQTHFAPDNVTLNGCKDSETESQPICMARKPIENTVAENVLKYGCGAINLDGCRIEFQSEEDKEGATWGRGTDILGGNYVGATHSTGQTNIEANAKGRFPANVIFDESAAEILDQQSGILKSGAQKPIDTPKKNEVFGKFNKGNINYFEASEGGASRFFYVAKASKEDRNFGCSGLEEKDPACVTDFRPSLKENPENWANGTENAYMRTTPKKNNHPTVKPITLMRYLVRLVKTPFDTCTIADFFMGSGTTVAACMLEGINAIGCDDDPNSYEIALARSEFAKQQFIKEAQKPKQIDIFQQETKPKESVKQQTFF